MFPFLSIMCETIFVVLNENSISVSKYVYFCPMFFFLTNITSTSGDLCRLFR